MAALALATAPLWAQAPTGPATATATGTATGTGAVLRGLDKIAGATQDFTLAAGETAVFGRLTITLRECRYPVGDPASDAFARLVIRDARVAEPVFRGWMVASSPALNALDHPRYDVWVIRCTSS